MNGFKTLPTLLVRHGIFPFLDSLDILACRYTCKSLKNDASAIPTMLSDGADKTTKYWRWIYSIIECWCYRCEPMSAYLYWIVRVARYQTIAAFFNSYRYSLIIKHCPDTTSRAMLGASARGDLRIAKLVRGCTPHICYRRDDVLAEACKHNNTNVFTWLIDMGDMPDSNHVQAFNIAIYIGEQGNLSMMKVLLVRGFSLQEDHWWLIAIHALRHRHNHLLRYIFTYAPNSLFNRRFMLASITHDNPVAFRVFLEKTNDWPTAEDSEYLRIYNAGKVARIWDVLGFPMLGTVRRWYTTYHE